MQGRQTLHSLGKSVLAGVVVALAILVLMAEHARRHDSSRSVATILNAEAFYAQF